MKFCAVTHFLNFIALVFAEPFPYHEGLNFDLFNCMNIIWGRGGRGRDMCFKLQDELRRQERGHSHLLSIQRGEREETFWNFANHPDCSPWRRVSARHLPLPNVRSLVLETRGAPPLCPLHPPSWHCWPCLPMPHRTAPQLTSSARSQFSSHSPRKPPDHPDEVRCPPHTGSPKHPLLTLLTAHTQPFTTACSPVPPSPE